MKITLLRHSEVDERYKGCYNGEIDIKLSHKGYTDATSLKKVFECKKFEAVFCSDMLRCKKTLDAFCKHPNITYTKALREKSWGAYEGLSYEQIVKRAGIKYKNFYQWIDALGGEELSSFENRVKKFFENLYKSNYKSVLIVTHGGVIKVFMSHIKSIPVDEAFCINVGYSSHATYDTETKEFNLFEFC